MNQIPNVEGTHNTREVEEWENNFEEQFEPMPDWMVGKAFDKEAVAEFNKARLRIKDFIHHQLQKAREEERERIFTAVSEYRDDANISGTDFEDGFNSGVDTILKYLKEETIDKNRHSKLDQPTKASKDGLLDSKSSIPKV